MSVQFKATAKVNPRNSEAAPKFYATAIQKEVTNIDTLCEMITSNTTLSRSDVYGVVIELIDKVQFELKAGRSVLLDKLGQFSLTLQSEGAETADELTAHNIKSAKIRFRSGKELNKMLNNLEYTKISE